MDKGKLYVVVKMLHGIVEDVEIYWIEEQAEKSFMEFTDIKFEDIEDMEQGYAGTNIYVCDLPKMEGVL